METVRYSDPSGWAFLRAIERRAIRHANHHYSSAKLRTIPTLIEDEPKKVQEAAPETLCEAAT
jgi:hypothetical protein